MKMVIIFLTLVLLPATSAYCVGSLFVRPLNSTQTYQSMHIKSYDVRVDISDHVATTHVDQVCVNELNARVESTFIFPLPEGAIITELYYWFNGIRYKGSVREKKEAQAAYDAKIRKFIDPALLQEIGDNVFKLNIAPIDPLSEVRFEIVYTEIMPFTLGRSIYTHFLKVTGLSTKPLARLSLSINALTSHVLKEAYSPSYQNSAAHAIDRVSDKQIRVTMGDESFLPTKDYKLELTTVRSEVEFGALTYTPSVEDSIGMTPFFLSWVIPPDSNVSVLPRNIVFVADVSSSMEGQRMEQLREALHAFISNLNSSDRFNIVTFSTGVVSFKPDLIALNVTTSKEAHYFVEGITALGLTNISASLKQAVQFSYSDSAENICVFLTDGEPSWGILKEQEIVDSLVVWNSQRVRIYPISIGTNVKLSLLKNIAKSASGFVTEIAVDDSIATLVGEHLKRISLPHLTQLDLNYGNLQKNDVVPSVLGPVMVGGRVIQAGRYADNGWYPLTLNYVLLGKGLTVSQPVFFGDPSTNNKAVAKIWAQYRINALLEEIARLGEVKELVDAVIDLSIKFEILTKYTALYADPDDNGNTTGFQEPDKPVELVELSISPNPIVDMARLTLDINSAYTLHHLEITIVDILGKTVAKIYAGLAEPHMTFTVSAHDVAGSPLSPGTYSIVCTLGSFKKVLRFAVQ